jgi:fatty acid amide hydrolase 2
MSKGRRHHKSSSQTGKMFKEMMMSLLYCLIYFVRSIVDKVVNLALEWYLGEKKICPTLRKDFFIMKSATEIAELIRNRDLTCHEVVNAYINRIIETNPIINAVMDGPFMDALDEAKNIDDILFRGEISANEFKEKPFLGVPFTTKDSTAVGGKLMTFGIVSRRNKRASEDAECVRLMKNSGAIIIATSSIPEVNRW